MIIKLLYIGIGIDVGLRMSISMIINIMTHMRYYEY